MGDESRFSNARSNPDARVWIIAILQTIAASLARRIPAPGLFITPS
jgi:hypothetical protein